MTSGMSQTFAWLPLSPVLLYSFSYIIIRAKISNENFIQRIKMKAKVKKWIYLLIKKEAEEDHQEGLPSCLIFIALESWGLSLSHWLLLHSFICNLVLFCPPLDYGFCGDFPRSCFFLPFLSLPYVCLLLSLSPPSLDNLLLPTWMNIFTVDVVRIDFARIFDSFWVSCTF